MALILGEIVVRSCGSVDKDGNFFVNTLKCYPYQWPVKRVRERKSQRLFYFSKYHFMGYDRNLGWAPRPSSMSPGGMYIYNKDAIRTPSCDTVISKSPSQGVLRISIFGDSFVHGNEVFFKDTMGYYLEEDLKRKNINAEVLNFGVPGYGMDQAFLRWKEQGANYKASIVIFGLQLENMNRNVNLVWPILYPGTGIPFAKPRFILEQGNLSLIDVPTPYPNRLIDIMNDFSSWKLAKYEYWYEPEEYQKNILFKSKLIAFVYSWFRNYYKEHSTHSENPEKLSLKIIASFKKEVEAAGGKFYVVYLPAQQDEDMLKDKILPHPNFFKRLEEMVPVIHPEARFSLKAGDVRKFLRIHYTPKGNKIVADAIANFIIRKNDQKDKASSMCSLSEYRL